MNRMAYRCTCQHATVTNRLEAQYLVSSKGWRLSNECIITTEFVCNCGGVLNTHKDGVGCTAKNLSEQSNGNQPGDYRGYRAETPDNTLSAAPSSNTGRILAFHPNKSETVRNLQTSRRRGFSLNNRAVGCISHQLRNACASNHAPALGELVRPVEIR